MKKVKRLITSLLFVLISLTTISAAWSNLFTREVPNFGGWSTPSVNVIKTDSIGYAYFRLEDSPHLLPVYGDLLQNGKRSTEKYYQLQLDSNVRMKYGKNFGAKGTYQQGRVASHDLEPNYRVVTFKFLP